MFSLHLSRRKTRSIAVLQPPPTSVINQQPFQSFKKSSAPYLLPKDDPEAQRLNFQHHLLKSLLAGNYAAPINNLHSVLDVGCGTGRWVTEMAQEFPATQVVGLDIQHPILHIQQPANTLFLLGDILKGLPFANQSFDFVHQRLLVAAIPAANWRSVILELMRVTRSGGWIELVEA